MSTPHNLKHNLADQDYWNTSYSDYALSENETEDEISGWLNAHVPPGNGTDCLEIGCFPGRYLTFFGKRGYVLHGVDLTPRVKTDFSEWLRARGFRTGRFEMADFFEFEPGRLYDIVCSFGFIEHFTNWEMVFKKHLRLVAPGGYIIIETPNFRGWMQRAIHYILDRANYKRHYIPAMDPVKWAQICRQEGFEIVTSGYIGEFSFWTDKMPEGRLKEKLFKKLLEYTPWLKKRGAGLAHLAPYCGIIAKRKKTGL
jgi:L-malate glycosyltransferase